MLRYDYAIFDGDRFLNNAMLTREEAARMERDGLRCVDVEASMDRSLPRFPDRSYVRSSPPFRRGWRRD